MSHLVIVPKTADALEKLDYDSAEDHELLRYDLPDKEFLSLFQCRFFSRINSVIGCNIDDYEDEHIVTKDGLISLITICQEPEFSGNILIKRIEEMAIQALDYETGIFFYF